MPRTARRNLSSSFHEAYRTPDDESFAEDPPGWRTPFGAGVTSPLGHAGPGEFPEPAGFCNGWVCLLAIGLLLVGAAVGWVAMSEIVKTRDAAAAAVALAAPRAAGDDDGGQVVGRLDSELDNVPSNGGGTAGGGGRRRGVSDRTGPDRAQPKACRSAFSGLPCGLELGASSAPCFDIQRCSGAFSAFVGSLRSKNPWLGASRALPVATRNRPQACVSLFASPAEAGPAADWRDGVNAIVLSDSPDALSSARRPRDAAMRFFTSRPLPAWFRRDFDVVLPTAPVGDSLPDVVPAAERTRLAVYLGPKGQGELSHAALHALAHLKSDDVVVAFDHCGESRDRACVRQRAKTDELLRDAVYCLVPPQPSTDWSVCGPARALLRTPHAALRDRLLRCLRFGVIPVFLGEMDPPPLAEVVPWSDIAVHTDIAALKHALAAIPVTKRARLQKAGSAAFAQWLASPAKIMRAGLEVVSDARTIARTRDRRRTQHHRADSASCHMPNKHCGTRRAADCEALRASRAQAAAVARSGGRQGSRASQEQPEARTSAGAQGRWGCRVTSDGGAFFCGPSRAVRVPFECAMCE
jgi:hypothetical protein